MGLFDGLSRRVADRAREVSEEARERVEQAFALFPDVRLRREGNSVVVEATGLLRRWLSDARLRFASWKLR